MNPSSVVPEILASNMAAVKSLDCLIIELEHYRKQSEWLSRINDLHTRLASAVDVNGMIEAFSVWLMPFMDHDLIAYENPARNRKHLFCSCHGPDRRRVIRAATKIFNSATASDLESYWCEGHYFVQVVRLNSRDGGDRILLLKHKKTIELLDREFLGEVREIISESLQRSLDYEDVFEQSRRDPLTGLANRRVFEERVEQLMESGRRYGHPVTIASMDLDNFKRLNDTLGHTDGDIALQRVAMTMNAMIRNSDLLVRMGGDEFVLIMQDTNLKAARHIAERLCQAIENLNIETGDKGKLGISIGLAQWQNNMDKDDWLQQADEVLYQAKATGRSRVCISS
jgi:diguanylate cyclase (GGDEF)-like protein